MGAFIGCDYRCVILRFELGDLPKIYKIYAPLRIRCEKGAHLR